MSTKDLALADPRFHAGPMQSFCRALVWLLLAGSHDLPAADQAAAPPRPTAAVFRGITPEAAELARVLAAHAESAGYAVEPIDAGLLTNLAALTPARFDLLVLPQARVLPADSVTTIEAYLKSGGHVLALGLPAWQDAVFAINGRWWSRAEYERAVASTTPQRRLLDFEDGDLSKWSRASDRRDPGTRLELEAGERGRSLHVVVGNLTGWDTLASPALAQPFPPGQGITCFRAKGSPRTHQLSIEWNEQDGSRWIATVDLTPEWKAYALPPEAFKAWTPPPGRGGKGDRFNPARATRLVVGLSHSHTALEGPRHEYWFDDLGTARHPFGDLTLPDTPALPHLEGLSPGYLFHPVNLPAKIGLASSADAFGRTRLDPVSWPAEASHVLTNAAAGPRLALHPRPQGAGFDQGRPWRWQPLIEARDVSGDYRGAVAALIVQERPRQRGSMCASFTPAEPEFYRSHAMQPVLRETLTAMRRGVFLLDGGSAFFTAFEGQPVRLGARVLQAGRGATSNLAVRVTVTTQREGTAVFTRDWPVAPAPGAVESVEGSWRPDAWPPGGFAVRTELRAGDEILDRLGHELHVWRPKPKPEFVEARDGGFWWRGRPWKAHGVNYMPSTGIGLAEQNLFEHWIGRGAYDPDIIERDLRRIKAMGLNAVSAFIYRQSLEAQHLLDFLRRCEALDLRVNLSLRPGTPLDFRWTEMKELIDYYQLAQNDTVFAYDLAWEPSHHNQAHQQRAYATAWNAWVLQRHGSLDAAEQAWSTSSNSKLETRNPEPLTVPPMSQLIADGPWRKQVADYRLFLDERLGAQYAEARRLVRSIDPHHPVSFRMQHAGDPTLNWDQLLPYDCNGLRDAVDIWEPEAYGRIGDWNRVKAGHFTAAYARLCDPAKPVLWAEMGYNVWDLNRLAPHPEKLAFAARYYADFYRMLIESGADGIFFWWYPGGYRLNERSDFGLLNPDGTDRALTKVIREEGARFLAAPKLPAPDHWIAVDRDRDARGLFGIYESVQAEYWRAIAAGKTPGLRWVRPPGGAEKR